MRKTKFVSLILALALVFSSVINALAGNGVVGNRIFSSDAGSFERISAMQRLNAHRVTKPAEVSTKKSKQDEPQDDTHQCNNYHLCDNHSLCDDYLLCYDCQDIDPTLANSDDEYGVPVMADMDEVIERRISDSDEVTERRTPDSYEVTERRDSNSDKATERRDSNNDKSTERRDSDNDKSTERRDSNSNKSTERRDSNSNKSTERRDSNSDKASERRDSDSDKASERRDSGNNKASERRTSDSDESTERRTSVSEKVAERRTSDSDDESVRSAWTVAASDERIQQEIPGESGPNASAPDSGASNGGGASNGAPAPDAPAPDASAPDAMVPDFPAAAPPPAGAPPAPAPPAPPAPAAPIVSHIDPNDAVQHLLGEGVVASNIRFAGALHSVGIFEAPEDTIPITEGIVLSNGNATQMFNGAVTALPGVINEAFRDEVRADLQTKVRIAANMPSLTASVTTAVLEFDVTPDTESLAFTYFFMSTEFNQGVSFNDIFALWIFDPTMGMDTGVNFINAHDGIFHHNVARLPNGEIVTISNARGGGPEVFNNNAVTMPFATRVIGSTHNGIPLHANGITEAMYADASELMDGNGNKLVVPGRTLRIRMAIADVSDTAMRSKVIIKAGSVSFRRDATGILEDDGTASVTIFPTSTGFKYLLIYPETGEIGGHGSVLGADGQTRLITGLQPGTKYILTRLPLSEWPVGSYPTSEELLAIAAEQGQEVVTPIPPPNPNYITTTDTTIIINPSNPNHSYAIWDPETNSIVMISDGAVDGWKPGNGGPLIFNNLTPGKTYQVITIFGHDPDIALFVLPGTPAVTKFTTGYGNYYPGEPSTTSITVSPTVPGLQYAIVNENGEVVGVWQPGNGGELTFDGLTPGGLYKVINLPGAMMNPPLSGFQDKLGVLILAPIRPVDTFNVITGAGLILIKKTNPDEEYALYDPASNIVNGEWKNHPDGFSILYRPLYGAVEYNVVNRLRLPELGDIMRTFVLPGVRSVTRFLEKSGGYNSETNKSSLTVYPTSKDFKYAAIDSNGNVAGTWLVGTDDELTLGELTPGEYYVIAAVDAASTPSNSGHEDILGLHVMAPTSTVSEGTISRSYNSITISGTSSSREYAVVDPVTGQVEAGVWYQGTGGKLSFGPLVSDKEYLVVTRALDPGADVRVFSVPSTQHGTLTRTDPGRNSNLTLNIGDTVWKDLAAGATLVIPEGTQNAMPVPGRQLIGWNDGARMLRGGQIYVMPERSVTFTPVWESAHNITGSVVLGEDSTPIVGVNLKLMRGTQVIATTTSAADGTYSITDIANGSYNLVAERNDGTVVTKFITVDGSHVVGSAASVKMPVGIKSSVVDIAPLTPDIVAGDVLTLFDDDNIFRPEDQQVVDSSGSVSLAFMATLMEEEVIRHDAEKIWDEMAGSEHSIIKLFDFRVEKRVQRALSDEVSITIMPVTKDIMEIIIPLPVDWHGIASYRTYRVHKGVASELPLSDFGGERFTLNSLNDTLRIYSNSFSTYALAVSNEFFYALTGFRTGPAANPATRVKPGEESPYSDVSRLLNTDDHFAYVFGTDGNLFNPNHSITRAETAQILYNLLRDKDVHTASIFPDVPGNAWYAQAVDTIASIGIIRGYPDGRFHPDANITRGEFVTLVVQFARENQGNERFTDVLSSHWAYAYVNTAVNFGWVKGVGAGVFEPDRNITRSEAVSLMNRVLRRYADRDYIETHPEVNRFVDVNRNIWSFYDIMEASYTHDFEKVDGIEVWLREAVS